jgi:hypothetical protein
MTPFRAVLAALLALGCSAGGRDHPAPTATDSAGVQLVTSGARGQWAEGQAWRLVPDLRIGAVDGPAEYMFTWIAAIAVGPGDTVFVLDGGDRTIRAYDPEGRFLRRFGREGDGPGEYRAPTEVAATRDGLLVYDWRLRRLTLLSWTGEVLRTTLVTQWTPFGSRLRMLDDTTFALGITGGHSAPPRPTDGRFWLARFSTGGAARDTLIEDAGGEDIVHHEGQSVIVFSAPFARGPRWDAAPDGRVAYGRGADYVIDVYRAAPDLRLVARYRRTVPSLEATEADRAAYRVPYERPSARVPQHIRRQYADILATVVYPATWPAYDDLLFDDAGRLWVRRPVHAADSVVPWDVFLPDGVYLGEVPFPRGLDVLRIRGHALWGVRRDEFDVPSLVRYRIQGS